MQVKWLRAGRYPGLPFAGEVHVPARERFGSRVSAFHAAATDARIAKRNNR